MADRPIRIQLSRAKGFDLQATSMAVNVARPTLFGNPFTHDDSAVAVEAFRRYCDGGTQHFEMGPGKLQFAKKMHQNSLHHAWPSWLKEEGLPAIRGKNLACWCKPGAPCHADVLLELANPPQCEEVA
ncbi:hypothetical protein ABIA18_005623 [Sinorhizobium fredii]